MGALEACSAGDLSAVERGAVSIYFTSLRAGFGADGLTVLGAKNLARLVKAKPLGSTLLHYGCSNVNSIANG